MRTGRRVARGSGRTGSTCLRVIPASLAFWLVVGLSGCSTPLQHLTSEVKRFGFAQEIIRGQDFLHVVYLSRPHQAGEVLHVYLEGDGTPWLSTTVIAPDPTPHNPLMLRLMALDPQPSIYLGRPCYNGLAEVPPCAPCYWTHQRFAPAVVASMAAVLRIFIEREGYRELMLFGHSGGGTLAMLMAELLPETSVVVTIAANLDIDAWADLHGYTRLRGSLNPARRAPLNPHIRQVHLAGGRDRSVPPRLIEAVVGGQPSAEFRLIERFDHACCWEEAWPSLLTDILRTRTSDPP